MWKRFPVPEFDRDEFKDMAWQAPAYLSGGEADRLIAAGRAGEASAYGAYPVLPGEEFFAKLNVRGDHSHAILCVLPEREVRIVGRSYAWPIQRAWIVDALDPEALDVVADWKTPRPMNNRLGPDDGVACAGGSLYLVTGHGYGDHWIGNRTIADNDWDNGEGGHGFRVLSSAVEDSAHFHDCNVSFEWTL